MGNLISISTKLGLSGEKKMSDRIDEQLMRLFLDKVVVIRDNERQGWF